MTLAVPVARSTPLEEMVTVALSPGRIPVTRAMPVLETETATPDGPVPVQLSRESKLEIVKSKPEAVGVTLLKLGLIALAWLALPVNVISAICIASVQVLRSDPNRMIIAGNAVVFLKFCTEPEEFRVSFKFVFPFVTKVLQTVPSREHPKRENTTGSREASASPEVN